MWEIGKTTKSHAIWKASPDDFTQFFCTKKITKVKQKRPQDLVLGELMWKPLGKPTSPADYCPNKADLWHSAF